MSLDAHSKHLVPRLHRHSLQDKLHGPEGMPGSHGAWQSLSLQLRGLSPAVSFRLQVACGGRWNSGSLFPFPSPVFLEPVLWRPCGFPLQTRSPPLPLQAESKKSARTSRVILSRSLLTTMPIEFWVLGYFMNGCLLTPFFPTSLWTIMLSVFE